MCLTASLTHMLSQTNVDGQTPEELEGLGDREQRRVREYVVAQCGKYE
jgi:26S proteasome non-ATPase regulatory subunit 10